LEGSLDLLILKTLVLGPCHGQGRGRLILRQSEESSLTMARNIWPSRGSRTKSATYNLLYGHFFADNHLD
jgi:hypothetical protein